MIVSKIILNAVAGRLVKHFRLDKVMSYVFEDNELDKKLKQHDKRILKLENIAHPKKDFVVCNKCNQQIKEK